MMASFIKENTYFASYPYEVFLYLKYQQSTKSCACDKSHWQNILRVCQRLLTWPDVGPYALMTTMLLLFAFIFATHILSETALNSSFVFSSTTIPTPFSDFVLCPELYSISFLLLLEYRFIVSIF